MEEYEGGVEVMDYYKEIKYLLKRMDLLEEYVDVSNERVKLMNDKMELENQELKRLVERMEHDEEEITIKEVV